MNNYCLMAGQMMSLVTHNANRCVSFMKIVGFVWNCMTEWFFGPSSELAAMTAHLPGCRCKMSQHKLDELSHHGMKPGTGLNLAWCTELHYARQGLHGMQAQKFRIPPFHPKCGSRSSISLVENPHCPRGWVRFDGSGNQEQLYHLLGMKRWKGVWTNVLCVVSARDQSVSL